MNVLFRTSTLFLGLLLIWQTCVWFWQVPTYIFPTPVEVFAALKTQYGMIIQNLWPTLFETLVSFTIGTLLGVMAALLLAFFKPVARMFLPILIISQAIPTFAIAPLFVIWFGYGLASKIAIAVLIIFFPITSAFYDGLRNTPTEYLDLAKTMNASALRVLFWLRIPHALPALASGLRIAAVACPLGVIVGEWVGASSGLGYLMLYADERMQIDVMFAILIVIISLSLLLYFLVDKSLRKLIHWH